MPAKKDVILVAVIFTLLLSFNATVTAAYPPKEYEAVVKHLKTRYKAKKVNLLFMWLARAAVNIAKPAGVKSFSLTVFQDLKFSAKTIDSEMQGIMKHAYGPEWSPIFHVRSREGQQAYLYMREAGVNVKLVLVTIDKENAAVIRATFSPDRLADFINDPKVFGISLNDDRTKSTTPAANANPQNQ